MVTATRRNRRRLRPSSPPPGTPEPSPSARRRRTARNGWSRCCWTRSPSSPLQLCRCCARCSPRLCCVKTPRCCARARSNEEQRQTKNRVARRTTARVPLRGSTPTYFREPGPGELSGHEGPDPALVVHAGRNAPRRAVGRELEVLLQVEVRRLRLQVHVVDRGVTLAREEAGHPGILVAEAPHRER